MSARDVRIGRMLSKDKGVTNRLIDQALYGFSGRKYRLAVRGSIAIRTTPRDELFGSRPGSIKPLRIPPDAD